MAAYQCSAVLALRGSWRWALVDDRSVSLPCSTVNARCSVEPVRMRGTNGPGEMKGARRGRKRDGRAGWGDERT